jgi:tRNA (adenine37-N6)-methyltransferase
VQVAIQEGGRIGGMDDTEWTVTRIGTVRSSRAEADDDDWGEVTATIALDPPFDERSVAGLAEFSHVEVLFLFDRVDPNAVCEHSRHPRGNLDWPEVGIFAQRAKDRPNRLRLSTCELVRVEGRTIHVRGLDVVDGTPVLDVKPYLQEFAPRGPIRHATWATELMANYF